MCAFHEWYQCLEQVFTPVGLEEKLVRIWLFSRNFNIFNVMTFYSPLAGWKPYQPETVCFCIWRVWCGRSPDSFIKKRKSDRKPRQAISAGRKQDYKASCHFCLPEKYKEKSPGQFTVNCGEVNARTFSHFSNTGFSRPIQDTVGKPALVHILCYIRPFCASVTTPSLSCMNIVRICVGRESKTLR